VVDDASMGDVLPVAIAEAVQGMPEFRMGVHRVGVRLVSGLRVDDVLVSGVRVTRVLGLDQVPFNADEVVEAVDQSAAALPPGI
jgi:hypothetical protein